MSVLDAHADYRAKVQAFARDHVRPVAATIDRAQAIPRVTIDALVAEGLFASGFPTRFGGTVERAPGARRSRMHWRSSSQVSSPPWLA